MAVEVNKTWDDERLIRERLERLQERMRRDGIGALYLTDGTNVRYVLNLKVPGGKVFVPARGEAIAFVRARDLEQVKISCKNVRMPLYRRDSTGDLRAMNRFAQQIGDLMADYQVAGEALGMDRLDVAGVLALMDAGVRLADAWPALEHAQSIKTQDEVAIYRIVGEQYASTITAFRDAIRPGVSENELAGVVISAWYEAGGEDVAQLNVCSGENMNPWRRWPSQRTLRLGEFVGIDLHARGIHGLRGNVSRTFFVGGGPAAEQRDLFRRAYVYLLAAVENFRVGRSFAEIVDSLPQVPKKYQTQLYNYGVGHGLGLGSTVPPLINRRRASANDTLKPNQVLMVGSYFGEQGSPLAVKLEEMILVREGQPEVLGRVPFDDRFVP